MSETTRRDLIRTGAVLATALTGVTSLAGNADRTTTMNRAKFRMKYAPHFGMFSNHAGNDPIDQLKFAAGEGFHAWEDNGMAGRSVAEQSKIASTMTSLSMTMGVFVVNMSTAWGTTLANGNADSREKFLAECKVAVDVAKRVNAKWMTVVCGTVEPRLHMGYQTANVVDALRRASEIFEPHGLVMVLEPLNFRDHPNLFLTDIGQAFQICRAVDSPACKILFDLYHQQVTEGNLIPNIDQAWSEIAYYQIGDNPGRNEPTTGEVNYQGVFKHLHGKAYEGVLGMEHGVSRGGVEGERALINAYRHSDSF